MFDKNIQLKRFVELNKRLVNSSLAMHLFGWFKSKLVFFDANSFPSVVFFYIRCMSGKIPMVKSMCIYKYTRGFSKCFLGSNLWRNKGTLSLSKPSKAKVRIGTTRESYVRRQNFWPMGYRRESVAFKGKCYIIPSR